MRQRIKVIRRRVGRVSFYQHHGGWWVYHREFGKPVRHLVGESAALAECEASLINAWLVAHASGVPINLLPSMEALAGRCKTN